MIDEVREEWSDLTGVITLSHSQKFTELVEGGGVREKLAWGSKCARTATGYYVHLKL